MNFNGAFLIKSLVRWFGNVPLKEEATALDTILLVLGVNYKLLSIRFLVSPSAVAANYRVRMAEKSLNYSKQTASLRNSTRSSSFCAIPAT